MSRGEGNIEFESAINYQWVMAECCRVLGTSAHQMIEQNKTRHVADHRAMTAWVLRELGMSYPAIGAMLHRDHSGVMAMVKKVVASPVLLSESSHLVEAFRKKLARERRERQGA
jgi:chromosomal replication initiation ATPase DnaA